MDDKGKGMVKDLILKTITRSQQPYPYKLK